MAIKILAFAENLTQKHQLLTLVKSLSPISKPRPSCVLNSVNCENAETTRKLFCVFRFFRDFSGSIVFIPKTAKTSKLPENYFVIFVFSVFFGIYPLSRKAAKTSKLPENIFCAFRFFRDFSGSILHPENYFLCFTVFSGFFGIYIIAERVFHMYTCLLSLCSTGGERIISSRLFASFAL